MLSIDLTHLEPLPRLMNSAKAKLTQGSVARHLANMTLPMLLGITTMMAQALIDAWFLGVKGVHERGRIQFPEIGSDPFLFPFLFEEQVSCVYRSLF